MTHKEYMKEWRKNNKEKIRIYLDNTKEKRKIYSCSYYIKNSIYIKRKGRKYYNDNRRGIKKRYQAYMKTTEGKEISSRHYSKRKGLGFIPLNEPFNECEAHHISKNFVIYIPTELHQALYHNIWTWQGMEEMNKLAIQWL